MSYESQQHSAVTRQLGQQLREARTAQLKRDCRALLRGGMPSGVLITQDSNKHSRNTYSEPKLRPQDAAGLLATDYALNDYNTWK